MGWVLKTIIPTQLQRWSLRLLWTDSIKREGENFQKGIHFFWKINRTRKLLTSKGIRDARVKKNSEVKGSLYLLLEYLHEEMLQAQSEVQIGRGKIGDHYPLKFFL